MSDGALSPEKDPAAVAEALRRLSELAVQEDCSLINSLGGVPDDVKNLTLSGAIQHPIWFACRYAINVLILHLGSLIGAEAAHAQFAAILAEQRLQPEVREAQEKLERASGKPAPSTLRSVH